MSLLPKKLLKKKKKETVVETLFSSHWLYNMYLALVSIVSVIVICVSLGTLASGTLNYIFITDQEYILSDRAWEIQQCSEPRYAREQQIEKTPQEILECEQKATERLIVARSVDMKETFINSLTWLVIFAILFGFHYPKFLATRDEK
ncbi:hypothetical protein N9J72_01040 [Candidatus Gracilibacteria bacterium]|nr:hypothetical protein [Candidatus Gracilibacteria bacterium]